MAWTTRAPSGGAVLVKDGGLSINSFPFGARLLPSGLRVWYNQDVFNIGWRDSANLGATWTGPSTTYKFWGDLPAGQGGGFTTIRRGRSGRLHAAISRFRFGGTWTTTYPGGTGWTIHYDAYYSYSDDGSTWAPPVEIFFETGPSDLLIGSFTPMEVVELSNGEIIFSGDYYEHVTYMTSAGDLQATRLYRSTDGGASFTYERDIISPATWGGLTSEFQMDVIHDGSPTGLLVGTVADYSGGDPPARRMLRSTDGGVTWNTGLALLSSVTVNRGGILAHPDGDVIFTAATSHGSGSPMWWVSRDQGVTYTPMGDVLSGTFQPAAGGTGGYVANKWITPFAIDGAGLSPNLGIAWGSGSDDAHGSTFFRAFTRGADVVAPLEPLTVTPTAVWSAAGRTVSIAGAPALIRSTAAASVVSVNGGLVRFAGTHADRFFASLDGTTWASRVTVPAGTTAIFLSVIPQAGDTTFSAQVGVPA